MYDIGDLGEYAVEKVKWGATLDPKTTVLINEQEHESSHKPHGYHISPAPIHFSDPGIHLLKADTECPDRIR